MKETEKETQENTFEEALQKLELAVEKLDEGSLSLEEAMLFLLESFSLPPRNGGKVVWVTGTENQRGRIPSAVPLAHCATSLI